MGLLIVIVFLRIRTPVLLFVVSSLLLDMHMSTSMLLLLLLFGVLSCYANIHVARYSVVAIVGVVVHALR